MLKKEETIGVVISCYNNWDSLEKVLWSYESQLDKHFEIILADDGSNDSFRAKVDAFRDSNGLKIKHVWHEDDGYRKAVILNKAIQNASNRYLLFTDGDIIVRNDWIDQHRRWAKVGYYMTGGSHINIPKELHEKLKKEEVISGKPFDTKWLRSQGMGNASSFARRLESHGWKARLFDFCTPRANSFVGCNSGCWKADAEKVNGFDESFGYSAEDRDLGVRMANAGVKGVRRRYSFVCTHMDHARPYLNQEEVLKYKSIIKRRRKDGTTRVNLSQQTT